MKADYVFILSYFGCSSLKLESYTDYIHTCYDDVLRDYDALPDFEAAYLELMHSSWIKIV
jgi:hypothetical protein